MGPLQETFWESKWEWLIGTVIAIVIIYFGLLRVPLHELSVESEAKAAVDMYIKSPTTDNAKATVAAFNKCLTLSNHFGCLIPFDLDKYVSTLIAKDHVELIMDLPGFGEEGSSYSDAWAPYAGVSAKGLMRKAEAFSRAGDFKNALPAYNAAFVAGDKRAVAIRMIRLFEHFGCIDDVAIWSEWIKPDDSYRSVGILPNGAAYPAQPRQLTDNNIIEQRVQLRRGVIPGITTNCPLQHFLK